MKPRYILFFILLSSCVFDSKEVLEKKASRQGINDDSVYAYLKFEAMNISVGHESVIIPGETTQVILNQPVIDTIYNNLKDIYSLKNETTDSIFVLYETRNSGTYIDTSFNLSFSDVIDSIPCGIKALLEKYQIDSIKTYIDSSCILPLVPDKMAATFSTCAKKSVINLKSKDFINGNKLYHEIHSIDLNSNLLPLTHYEISITSISFWNSDQGRIYQFKAGGNVWEFLIQNDGVIKNIQVY
jgi:hypothetical protein